MKRNPDIDHVVSIFLREIKRSKSKSQANLVFDISKCGIEKVKGTAAEKESAIRVMAIKLEAYK